MGCFVNDKLERMKKEAGVYPITDFVDTVM